MGEQLTTTEANLPAQQYNPAAGITADDVPKPRIKFAQPGQPPVIAGECQYGDIYSTLDGDSVLEVLAEVDRQSGITSPLRFYVLDFWKTYTWESHGEFRWGSRKPADGEVDFKDGKTTLSENMNYTVVLPQVADDLLYQMSFKGSGLNAARNLNFRLSRPTNVDPTTMPFDVTCKRTEKSAGSQTFHYTVPRVDIADVPASEKEKELEVVGALRSLLEQSSEPEVETPAHDGPAID